MASSTQSSAFPQNYQFYNKHIEQCHIYTVVGYTREIIIAIPSDIINLIIYFYAKSMDVIQFMEQGSTLLKYGKPKYKMFHLTPDHEYLVWFSQKKSPEDTRIRIKEIQKIAIGSESKIVNKTKNTDIHEASFDIIYGKTIKPKQWKLLTVTANNEMEAKIWCRGLKILSDTRKRGKHLRTLDIAAFVIAPKTELVTLQSQNVLNLFSKSGSESLLKQHAKHKQLLKKCVDFVMTKANYRAIANAKQYDKVRFILEDLGNRLADVKKKLIANKDMSNSELSVIKDKLFLCVVDLEVLVQKLSVIVGRPQKL